MARLLPCYSYISKSFSTESSFKAPHRLHYGSWKITEQKRFVARTKVCVVHCCTSATSPPLSSARINNEENQLEDLVSEFGWKVRRLAKDQNEMKEVAQIQAEAFHTPVALFDDFFFEFFKAEVLSGLLYKLKNSPPDRYACLVAEPAADSSNSQSKLVGVVDITAMRDQVVLKHLSGTQEYLYVSGIAVSTSLRRKKIATVLLKACDALSILLGFEYLALRAYEDDWGARKLYANAGYKVVSSDPQWVAWMGRRRRVLMIKPSNFLDQQF